MFTVTQVIQSIELECGEGPVDVQWYRGDDHAAALAALVQASASTGTPYYNVLSARIDLT